MGIPQGTDRMRLGPTEALRAVFAGIGRIVMAADRPQANGGRTSAEATAATDRTRPNGQASGRSRRARGKAEPPSSRWRSLDETGNVRLLTADDLDDGDVLQGRAAGPVTASSLAAPAEDAPLAVDLPLASYDTLSLASIRARLRALDVGQLRMLVAYEQANAERPEVLGMLERRIEKLETGG